MEADNKKLQSFSYLKKKKKLQRSFREVGQECGICLDEGEEMSIIGYNENAAPRVKYETFRAGVDF